MAGEPARDGKTRCPWCASTPEYRDYHDREWGVPVHDDRLLFEFLVLEGAQAGLSWLTILRRRAGYRQAYGNFVPEGVAAFGPADVERLLADPGIIRNRRKVESSIRNARAFLAVQAGFGSFARYMWGFTDGRPVVNRWRTIQEIPARTPLSDRWSRDLRSRGFSFVGSTICYSHLQAVGAVNDHLVDCFRHAELSGGPATGTPSNFDSGEHFETRTQ